MSEATRKGTQSPAVHIADRHESTPADLVAARSTLTGEHLAAYVGA